MGQRCATLVWSPPPHFPKGTTVRAFVPRLAEFLPSFPIGPYGFSDTADATSAITRVTSGYLCTSGGVACTTDTQRAIATNWVRHHKP